jgi:hypothetical protein
MEVRTSEFTAIHGLDDGSFTGASEQGLGESTEINAPVRGDEGLETTEGEAREELLFGAAPVLVLGETGTFCCAAGTLEGVRSEEFVGTAAELVDGIGGLGRFFFFGLVIAGTPALGGVDGLLLFDGGTVDRGPARGCSWVCDEGRALEVLVAVVLIFRVGVEVSLWVVESTRLRAVFLGYFGAIGVRTEHIWCFWCFGAGVTVARCLHE